MRISTNAVYDQAAAALNRQQTQLARTGEQISSGLRINSPADDPVGSARLIDLDSAKSRNDQLVAGEIAARNALSEVESAMASIGDVYADLKSLLVQAGNAVLSDNDRKSLAADVMARRDSLIGLANSRDAAGRYMFAGHRESQMPFVAGANGFEYRGDSGRRDIQVGLSRTMTVTASGADIFSRVLSGNGVFDARATAANTGTGVISAGSVADATALDGRAYRLAFHSGPAGTTYDILDDSGQAVAAAQPFVAGANIDVAGMRVQISGNPAEGDTFELARPASRTVFEALDDLVLLLRQPVADNAGRALLKSGLASAAAQIDQAAEKALLARADAGSALKELDLLSVANSSRDEQLQRQISELRDLDYAKATTELAQRQMVLQAAQQTYARILGKSIFEFL